MNDIQTIAKLPNALVRELAEIQTMNDCEQLRKLLVQSMSMTIEGIIRIATIVRRMDDLEYDLSDIEFALLPLMRKIAYGQVIPELVMRVQGRGRLLNCAIGLPIPDQRRVAEGEPLKVMQLKGDYRMVPPLKMNTREVSQVFDRDHIRDEGEQAAWLRSHTAAEKKPPSWDEEQMYLDRKRGGLVVGTRFIPGSLLIHYASQLMETPTTRRGIRRGADERADPVDA